MSPTHMSSLLDRLLRPLANVAYRIVRKRARGRLGVHAIAEDSGIGDPRQASLRAWVALARRRTRRT